MLARVAELSNHIPNLLARARALLRLPGGPPDELSPAEMSRAGRAVESLHRGLVARRELARASTYDDPTHLGAYLLWWWPQTYAKVRATLEMARAAGALPRTQPRLLDVGSGPAPAAIAVLDAFGGQAVAVDASEAALAEARALSNGRIETRKGDLCAGALHLDGLFDLVVIANALSELPAEARVPIVERLPVAPDGAVVMIEPALRETGRALLEVRASRSDRVPRCRTRAIGARRSTPGMRRGISCSSRMSWVFARISSFRTHRSW